MATGSNFFHVYFIKRIVFVINLLFFIAVAGIGQDHSIYPFIRTPQVVTVNYEIPKGGISNDEAIPVSFFKVPTDEEIYRVHFFEEPLVPSNGKILPAENIDLVDALLKYSQRKKADDFEMLVAFLKKYQEGRWNGAVLANLGIVYRRTGYYNKAMDAWQAAWILIKDLKEPKIKVLADRVISELLLINAWVGRVTTMDSIMQDIKFRHFQGPAVERIVAIRSAIWTMKNKPEISFKCGPYALNKLYTLKDSTKPFNQKMADVKSTSLGFSLSQLSKMARNMGLKYQMAYRSPGSEVIPYAVIHWKLDHYSSLLKQENGRYKCQDPTMGTVYGQNFWPTAEALDSSASGYFLIPQGPLPKGWRQVSEQEGSQVFGKGMEPTDPGKHVTPQDTQAPNRCNSTPMAQCNVHALVVSLHIYDNPVYYTPPVGPAINWNIEYHHRDSYQPSNFSYSNMGPKWTFNWLSYIQDDPNNPVGDADLYVMGGGARTFVAFNESTQSYLPEIQTKDILVRICPGCYELRHPDGSKEIYGRPDGNTSSGRKVFLTEVVDVAGNRVTLSYDAKLRIKALKDALGQVTTIKYENEDTYKITRIIDPFGRFATFQYDVSGRLIRITDMIGIASSFQYDHEGDFINQMTTPYGTTRFVKTETDDYNRSLEILYPLGEKERVEFKGETYDIPFSEQDVPSSMDLYNQNLVWRNTFYWDKKMMKVAGGDYTKAKIFHWLHGSVIPSEPSTAPILESSKEPLEVRVWYNYENQLSPTGVNYNMSSRPSKVGRILDDGTTQLYQYTYNEIGKITSTIDPLKRTFKYLYDTNKIDLLEVRQAKDNANELLAKFTYNSQHLPLTLKNASGLTTKYSYNSAGQLLTVKNPKNETTTFTYDSKGYLKKITGAVVGSTVSFTYDGYGRVRTVSDPEGYAITTDYDALDRPTLITYPDSSYEQIVYDRLDAVHIRDRLGRWSHTIYDSLDRATAVIDPLNRITQFLWCSCGSLSEIIDPLKNITSFTRDLQGRLITKTYPDGKSINYTYESRTSRLKTVTDAKKQKTNYSYFTDDNIKKISYTNNAISTPSVSFAYDAKHNRITKMVDGNGTTTYNYKKIGTGPGSGQLASEDSYLSNDAISYSYDSLGRLSGRSINGVPVTFDYDPLGRVISESNALGSFIYDYVNQTSRLSSITYPNGQVSSYNYYNNKLDQRLKQIINKVFAADTLSAFTYNYNKEGQIIKWTQQSGPDISYYNLGYDRADQLTSATLTNQGISEIIKRYAYRYDKAGNRTSEQIDNTVTSSGYNNLNQLTNRYNRGPLYFMGSVTEFSSVLVKNKTTADSVYATVDSITNSFEAFVGTKPGTNNISITATDYSGNNNKKTNNYSITVGTGAKDTLAFDANGNTVSESNPAVQYEWDAANRLVKITKGGNVTEFVYDGLSRRVAEKLNGTVIKRWLWCGTELCEERNAGGGTVTKRFFEQGEQINGTNYYFTKDHLGSVIEMTAASGNIKAKYSYDPYGRRVKVAGSLDADAGFTGHYYHAASGLHLAFYRAYDGNNGRWLNRDPIEEKGGMNLYNYVFSDPINLIDPNGLAVFHYWAPEGGGGGSKGGWYGHVSVTLDDGTYISYWPNRPINPPFDVTPSRPANYDQDVTGEGGREPYNIKITHLNEKAIKDWWENENHGDFGLLNNCSDIASEALRKGGLNIPYHLIYQPQNVKTDVEKALQYRNNNFIGINGFLSK